ncbi:2OG-Fe(II) oxygenase family protein [Ceratobasidium sp. AG-Ba]|nr:2OG-Fe(II) oxygenase family protein [Ceratobasidium sp. AG-Ba]
MAEYLWLKKTTGVPKFVDNLGLPGNILASTTPCRSSQLINQVIVFIVCLEDYSFAAHQDWADTWGPPEPHAPAWRTGPEVTLSRNRAQIVANFSHAAESHMRQELPKPVVRMSGDPPGGKKALSQRHLHNIDRFDLGCAGCRHYGLWHATGHQFSDSYGPTREMVQTRSNIQWSSRIQFLDSMHPVDLRVNYLVELLRPDFFRQLQQARQAAVTHPGFAPFNKCWGTPFLGRAVLVNRQSGEHLDRQGVRRAWDVIVAGGKYTGGDFFFKDMNLRCPFLPGDLVAFDGTAQRHQIESFAGNLRLSHVYFVHRSVLEELGIPTNLPDVYLSDIMSRVAFEARPPPTQGPPLPPGFYKGRGKPYAPVDRLDRRVPTRKKNRH